MIKSFSHQRIAAAFFLATAATIACGADFPTRPVRIVVPSTPGGVLDVLARLVSPKLTMKWGQAIVIDNRAGADGIIGTDIVAKSAPDGYTLLFAAPSFSTNPALYKLPYDTSNDFTLITIIGSTPNVLVAHPSLQAKSVKELIALARQTPGKINYASSGVGSGGHLAMELFKRMAGIDLTHVPYKGAGAAALGVVSGQSQLFATAPGTVIPQLKSGQLRALAVTSPIRSNALPDVPTFAESGFSGYAVVNSLSIAGPGKMPKALTNTIYGAIVEVLKMPDVTSQINAMAIDISGITPDKAREYINTQVKMWEGVMKAAGIRRSE
jgi:tripartite-type tricarboxylate transporter receptor subunit TctC